MGVPLWAQHFLVDPGDRRSPDGRAVAWPRNGPGRLACPNPPARPDRRALARGSHWIFCAAFQPGQGRAGMLLGILRLARLCQVAGVADFHLKKAGDAKARAEASSLQ